MPPHADVPLGAPLNVLWFAMSLRGACGGLADSIGAFCVVARHG